MAKTKKPAQAAAAPTASVAFPSLTPKQGLVPRVLLEDQIILIHGVLDAEECKRFVAFVDSLPLEMTPPKKRNEAVRVNYRTSIPSPSFAQALHTLLLPFLPSFPRPGPRRAQPDSPRLPHSLNSHVRLYKYTPTQHFGPHYDDAVLDALTGARSEWTLLIYLTGVEDGVEGGETVFYKESRGKKTETIIAPLTRGTALLHRHGQECLLHEGTTVREGTKYVLRSDLMFKKVD